MITSRNDSGSVFNMCARIGTAITFMVICAIGCGATSKEVKTSRSSKVLQEKQKRSECIDCKKCVSPDRFGKRMLTCGVIDP